jgi:hypothetical protein
MDKRHYYFKLIVPRPTFPADITEQEKDLMKSTALTANGNLPRASFWPMAQ